MKKTTWRALLGVFTLSLSFALASCSATVISAAPAAGSSAASTKSDETSVASQSAAESKSSVAADGWAKVEKAGKLIMGLDDNFPPMGFRDEKNEIVGFDVDLAKEVCKRLNIQLELLPIDWSMKLNELDAGNVDVLWNGFSYTDERNEKCTLSKPYLANDQVLVVMAKSGFKSLADLKGKNLALQEMSSAEEALDAAADFKASLAKIVPFKDNVTAFMDLESGASDCLLVDKVVGEYLISQKNPADYVVLEESLAPETYVVGFRKGDVELKDKVEAALSEMKADGSLAQIAVKWFGHDSTIFK